MLVPHVLAAAGEVAPSIWHDMFTLSVPVLEKVFRTIIVYFALMFGLRLAGKRELAQLNPFDLIVLLMLSNTVQNAIIGDDNTITGGLLGALTLLVINYAMVRVVHRNPHLQRLFEGEAEVLVRHGQVRKHKLEQELITKEELEAAAHQQGIASLHDVEKCILEPTGAISFIERTPTNEETRHEALMQRLDAVAQEITSMRSRRGGSGGGGVRRNGRAAEFRGATARNGKARREQTVSLSSDV
jgi:uncharacterized membrane protein YcaP (DUF421 family)